MTFSFTKTDFGTFLFYIQVSFCLYLICRMAKFHLNGQIRLSENSLYLFLKTIDGMNHLKITNG